MRFRQQYTLFPVKRKARYYVENLLNNENALRKIFSSDSFQFKSTDSIAMHTKQPLQNLQKVGGNGILALMFYPDDLLEHHNIQE